MKSNKQTFRDTKQQTTQFVKQTTHSFLLICFILALPAFSFSQNILRTRTIEQTDRCAEGVQYSFYISNADSTFNRRYQIQDGQFIEYDNGTARITGLAVNNDDSNIKWRIDVSLADRTFTVNPDSVKAPECLPLNVSDWYLYNETTGTFTGEGYMQGAVANMYRRGPAFQLGTGANETEKNSRFNGGGWHHIEFLSQPDNGIILENTVGDLNLNLTGSTLTEEESCTGEIIHFKINNDITSITLEDGGSYRIGDLPVNSTIEAVATGSHESIGFTVNGTENEENTVPYDHYWTPAIGTYTISASLFNEDNCIGFKCDEKTITIYINNDTPAPSNLSVDAGADVTICEEQTQLTATATGTASCSTGCEINNDQVIARWNMDQCVSFSGDVSNESYTEFGGTINNLSCTSVSSTGFYRHEGKHSCTDDGDNNAPGDAVCLGMPTISNWQDNHPKALRFDISLAGGGQVAGITKITFKEFAPANYLWSQEGYNDNTGINNYPTKYGVRILKNGVEILKQVNIATSTNGWNLKTIDLSSIPEFKSTETATYSFELLAYAPIGNGSQVSAWDLDDLKVFGGCCSSGITNDITYEWSTGETNASITANQTGTYQVTVTDCSGAQATDQVAVIVSESTCQAAVSQVLTSVLVNDATATVSDIGTNAPYTYQWSNGQTTPTATNLSAGNYTVTVTDNNGCQCVSNVTIDGVAAIGNFVWADTNNNGIQDAGEPGIPNVVVILLDGNDNMISQTTTDQNGQYIFDGLTPGSYKIKFPISTNTNGTDYILTTSNNGDETKDSDAQPMSGSNDAMTEIITLSPGDNSTDLDAGYIVGCSNINFNFSTTTSTDIPCNNSNDGQIDLSLTGGTAPYSYSWSNGATTQDLNDLAPDNYTVIITDANGCEGTYSASISEPAAITTNTNATNVACSGGDNGTVQVTVDGGTAPYTYNWSNGETIQNINSLTAGSYTVTITDANNCSTTATASVDQAGGLLVNVTQSSNSSCNGDNDGVISISVTGGTTPYSYEWNNGATTEDLVNLTAGEYTVTITDANDCSVTATATFTDPAPITATTDATNVACSGGDNGTVQVAVDGGTTPYSFIWNNGATTQNINSLTAGNYTVTITDANNCTITTSALVDQAGDLVVAVDQTTNVSCNGDNDGAVSISVEGGITPYSFDWNNGAITKDLNNLSAGQYTGIITDANGCSIAATVIITEPEILTGQLNIDNITCSGANTGQIDLSISGGSSPYTYKWSNGETTRNLSDEAGGVYLVTITDANDCVTELSGEILETTELQIETQRIENVTCQGNSNGLIDIKIVGGTAPYSFNWSNGTSGEDLSNLSAGSYQVTITDINGCEGIYESAIAEPEMLECKATILANLTNRGGSDASLLASALGGIEPYSYLWSTQQTTAEINNLSTGSYQVTITDQNECQCETIIEINDPVRVGDFVWEDLNGDGIQNPTEPGIPNVEVTLTGIDTNGNNVSLTVTTDENGQYDFDGLLPGTYKITFSTPANFASTPANVGNDAQDSDAQNGMTPEFTIEYGDEDLSFDAGFYNPINIGNFVWLDANNNGIQDVNEAGVNGVTINLFDLGPDETFGTSDDVLVETQTTQTNNGADGNYQFTGIAPGKYAVKFDLTDLPVDYDFTTPGASGNTVDSNADPVTGITETIMVISGQTDDSSIDAGLVLACGVTAAFTTQQKFCEDELAQFTAVNAGPGATYEWVFFNGTSNTSTFIGTRNGYDVPFRFTSPGEKFVKLVVTLPNGCQATEERILSVGGNIISGGTIGSNEENCGAFNPTIITNLSSPTGGNGNFEYIWMKSNHPTPPTSLQDPAWELIPGVNGLDYDPEMIEETTYYIRYSRMEYCTDYIGESNIVVKSINRDLISEFSTDDYICWKRPIEFMAYLQESGVSYQWLIFRGVDQTGTYLGAREGATIDFTFNQEGTHYVQLQVSLPNGCTGTYGEQVFVDGYSRVCGDSINLMVVTALNFDAQPKDDGTILLTWEISNEPNNVQYTIEYSTGDDDFEAIGNVKGNFAEHYEFVDDAPMFGINYYRLKYIYEDGTIDFSDIKQVVMRFDDKQRLNVFPNPTQGVTRLRLAEPDTEDTLIELVNGQGITLEQLILPAGETDVEFDLSMYESGHYFIYIKNKGKKSLLSRVMKVND